jgi:hypothetical protein
MKISTPPVAAITIARHVTISSLSNEGQHSGSTSKVCTKPGTFVRKHINDYLRNLCKHALLHFSATTSTC